jgi:tRNA nucleotidyltransferase (CCA-adding enzyme)
MEIPKEIQLIAEKLGKAGYEAHLVGGCVRDLLLKKAPRDWDIATNAKPKDIQKLFPDSVYENEFGTVGVKTDANDLSLKVIEITTYREEGKYTDKRHPDEVQFAKNIADDLSRRDFTMNAIAYSLADKKYIDPFKGEKDLQAKTIRAVGNALERFEEDALRLLRAVRLSAQLHFKIEKKTADAITKKAELLEFISKERIRDEITKLLMTDTAADGINTLQELGLLKHVFPELVEGVGIGQNKHHVFTVFEHNLKSLEYAAKKNFPLDIRIASLLHDVGKPRTKKGNGYNSTFYGHQVVGERMALKMLDTLRFPKNLTEKAALLIREHMFVYDPETVTLSGVRRLIARVGKDNMDDLIKLREADRIGSGVPKAQPYRLRYLQAMVEKVQKDPVHPKMLLVKGDEVMKILAIPPGPKVGKILAVLLEEVLDNPKLNTKPILTERVKELGTMTEKELGKQAKQATQKASEVQTRIDREIKKKYFVR